MLFLFSDRMLYTLSILYAEKFEECQLAQNVGAITLFCIRMTFSQSLLVTNNTLKLYCQCDICRSCSSIDEARLNFLTQFLRETKDL